MTKGNSATLYDALKYSKEATKPGNKLKKVVKRFKKTGGHPPVD